MTIDQRELRIKNPWSDLLRTRSVWRFLLAFMTSYYLHLYGRMRVCDCTLLKMLSYNMQSCMSINHTLDLANRLNVDRFTAVSCNTYGTPSSSDV